MIDNLEILETFKNELYIGNYDKARLYGNNLPAEVRSHSRIGLMRIRACMLQGNMLAAREAYQEIAFDEASPGEKLILAVEAASIHLFFHSEIRQAVEMAEAAFSNVDKVTIEPVLWAEARRVYIRIWLSAYIYYEVSRDKKHEILAELLSISEILISSGWETEGVTARLTYADNIKD
ncbi:MAG: hypothetical protein AAFR81_28405, partial [Chloroflexota bacterium]